MRKTIIISLLLAAFFVILASFISRYYFIENNFERLHNDFQTELNLKEKQLLNELTSFQTEYPFTNDSLKRYAQQQKKIYNDDGFAFFVYRNDSLAYWSTNEIPVNAVYNKKYSSQELLRLDNGFYLVKSASKNQFKFLGLFLIKKAYPYQNQYLNNQYHEDLNLPSQVDIKLQRDSYNILSLNGNFLFSLEFPGQLKPQTSQLLFLFALYFLAFIFIVSSLVNGYRVVNRKQIHPYFTLGLFVLIILLIRYVIMYFKIPGILYSAQLFGPYYYATSIVFSSLGDLIINAFVLFIIGFVFYQYFRVDEKKLRKKNEFRKYFAITTLVFHVFIFLKVLLEILDGIIKNSSVPLDLNNVFSFNEFSILAYLAIAFLLFAYFFIAIKLMHFAFIQSNNFNQYLISAIIALGVFGLLCSISSGSCNVVSAVFGLSIIITYWFLRYKGNKVLSFYSLVFYLVIFTAFFTYFLQVFNHEKEITNRKLMVQKLSTERDKIAEFSFREMENKIMTDSTIIRMMDMESQNMEVEQKTAKYLKENYFTGYWGKYNIQVTICHANKELSIQPDDYIINCHEYFNNIINRMGGKTICEHLYFLDDGTESINYIAVLPFKSDTVKPNYPIKMFLEISSRFVPKGLGYPELLIDKEQRIASDISGYSYGIYVDGELIKNVGNYFYSINLDDYQKSDNEFHFFDKNGYNHLHYKAEGNTHIIISKPNPGFLDRIAPFSYLLIFFIILGGLFYLILNPPKRFDREKITFRTRLQLSMIGVVIISFIIIGISSISYIVRLNHNKNKDTLREKAHSVLIELEHKLAAEDELTVAMNPYLNSILTKFSQVFFTDINLYNLNGELLASSRPEIFEQGLIASRMNAPAYKKLTQYKRALFIKNECIGNYNYLSAYVPFRNDQNELIAFLNLPYFARQTEIKNEISNFLVAFLNIYVILIALAVFLALLISNYITRPLLLIREKMRRVQLEKSNEKISWIREDEIGQLVIEYNRMIDELARSADLLAKSERELAWREMARQVAHEIKNPLTPMKLNVQYLKRAWDEDRKDMDERMKRFTQTIIEQIDSLSLIASEFSDFAKMPRTRREKVDLNQVINDSIQLYQDYHNIRIKYEYDTQPPFFIYSDKKQMLRVFNNLLKNSTQAIGKSKKGEININIQTEEENYLISLSDNGSGIPAEMASRIFSPSFTTKSSGMGIGLAMVRSIIINSKGNIWFESDEGEGTTFYIRLPKWNKSDESK